MTVFEMIKGQMGMVSLYISLRPSWSMLILVLAVLLSRKKSSLSEYAFDAYTHKINQFVTGWVSIQRIDKFLQNVGSQ